MKSILILVSLFTLQASAQKSLDDLIGAEKNFSMFSLRNGTRDAFLAYLDSNGIVFNNKKPVNGLQFWTAKDHTRSELDWAPEFAEISSSLDFGYTTGPWKFKKSAG